MAQQIHPKNVVGRDALIARIWDKLESGSIRFTAERRIGKTTVMKKMLAEPRSGHTPVFIDLEGVSRPDEFVEKLLNSLGPLLSTTQQGMKAFKDIWGKLEGVEIGSVIKLPKMGEAGWAATLDKLFEELCKTQGETRVVLLLDELPYMLQNIALEGDGGTENALKILDRLRAARQDHQTLRMVFAGSVGLHHVLTSLRGSTRASQPVNDMELVEIKPLSLPDATTLTRRLIASEKVNVASEAAATVAEELARATDCVPFYLERLVSRLAEQDAPATLEDAHRLVREHLTDDQDRWEMEHFRSRLAIYYLGTHMGAQGQIVRNEDLARAMLDFLASADTPQPIESIWADLKNQHSLADRNHVVQMLSSLAKDHYLIADTDKAYTFRFPLIRNWWVAAQGLTS